MKFILLLVTSLILAACDNTSTANAPAENTSSQQVTQGKQVFEAHCQECHGVEAAGLVKDWQKPDADGIYPAPPLNGSAHAWHHDMKTLLGTVNRGGIPLGGTMPAFKDTLTEEEKEAVLIYIQSLWPEELYLAWKDRNG
jgi:mono/diheme cytochrome c family protein